MGVSEATVSVIKNYDSQDVPTLTIKGPPEDNGEIGLFGAVIKRAADDLEISEHFHGRPDVVAAAAEIGITIPNEAYKKRRESNTGMSPRAFFKGQWFRDMCEHSGANPENILARLRAEGYSV